LHQNQVPAFQKRSGTLTKSWKGKRGKNGEVGKNCKAQEKTGISISYPPKEKRNNEKFIVVKTTREWQNLGTGRGVDGCRK